MQVLEKQLHLFYPRGTHFTPTGPNFGKLTDKTIGRVGKSLRQWKLVENDVDIELGLSDGIERYKVQLFERC